MILSWRKLDIIQDMPLSALYNRVTPKTLARDINFLKQQELVVIDGDQLTANLGILTPYTAISTRINTKE